MRATTIVGSAMGVVLLMTLTACGGSSTASDTTSAAAGTASAAPAASGAANGRPDFTAYRDCMAKNGVTLPDFQGGPNGGLGGPPSGAPAAPPSGAANAPGGNGGPGALPLPSGVDQATFDKAQAACADLRPQFGGGPGQIDQTALAAFTSCLTDHDVKVADGQDVMRQLDRTDAKVSAALKTCSPLLPQPVAPAASPSPTAS